MKISDLNDMEAVFGLRKFTEAFGDDIDLTDEGAVRSFVEENAQQALEDPNDVEAFMELFEQPKTAAGLARACLSTIHEQPELLGAETDQLEDILENPLRAQQMDMGISLGLLALAGMAMFLSGSLKIKTKNVDIEYQGSDAVVDIFKAVLPKIPGWK